jgi:sulfur transfer complex TusBCD TusB component (DsrH family)
MAKILSIVERAYKGTIEEQDDTALWINAALTAKNPDVTVLLRGNAVNYAVKGQDASGLKFGGVSFGEPPHIPSDIKLLQDKNVPVYAVREDVEERGIPTQDLLQGIQLVSRKELGGFVTGYSDVWYW